jgi:hypothetical protein
VLVVGANEILYVDCAGKIQCCTAVNGWVRSTGSAAVLPSVGSLGGILQPNPSPLAKLSVQLDGSRLSFVNEDVAMVSLRDGSLYSLELHGEHDCIGVGGGGGVCLSLAPVGKKLGGLGMIASLSVLPLMHVQTSIVMGKLLDKESAVAKKEEMGISDDGPSKSQVVKETISSLGLVFAGSRMGDSILMMYDLKENIKLVPLERDKEQEKAIADAVGMSEQGSKRKREEEDDAIVKKEKVEGNADDATNDAAVEEQSERLKIKSTPVSDDESTLSEEQILLREEEALYAPYNGDGTSAIIPFLDGDDNKTETLLPGITPKQLYRPQILSMSIFQDTKVLDCLTGLGPIGPGCTGPTVGKKSSETSSLMNLTNSNGKGSITNVHPCGFGASGGLAVLNAPGLNSSNTIVSEVDCLDIGSIFPCPNMGYFFVVRRKENTGCMIMKVAENNGERKLEEIEINSLIDEGMMDVETPLPSFESVRDVLTRMDIISVKEFTSNKKVTSGDFIMVFARFGSACALIIFSHNEGVFSIEHSHFIGAHDDGKLVQRDSLVSTSFVDHLDKSRVLTAGEDLSLACVWSSGLASTFSVSYTDDWIVREVLFDKKIADASFGGNVTGEGNDNEADKFYHDNSIVAVDIFTIANSIFDAAGDNAGVKVDGMNNSDINDIQSEFKFDEDDLDLYGEDEIGQLEKNSVAEEHGFDSAGSERSSHLAPSRYNSLGGYISGAGLSTTSKVVVAIARRSGQLEIHDVATLFQTLPDESTVEFASDQENDSLLWSSNSGFGQGTAVLDSSNLPPKRPQVQKTCAAEMRFFFSGPSNTSSAGDLSVLRSLCLIVETNQGDVHLYTASISHESLNMVFKRVSLHNIARQSKEEVKHRNKLQRKGVSKESDGDLIFRPNRLHRFFSISGQDGLFAAVTRPQWFVSERGAPAAINHRLRHSAPAGCADVPVFGFCCVFPVDNGTDVGFITVHDRVGRVGSQRLTLFNG